MKRIKIACICVVCAAVLTVSALNLFYPERPTVSERENRTLASFPNFSLSSLFDGSFFAGFDTFVSDNFIGREFLVDMAQKLTSYHSLSAFLPGHEDEVVFLPSKTDKVTDDNTSDDDDSLISDELPEKDGSSELIEEEISENDVEPDLADPKPPVDLADKEIVRPQDNEIDKQPINSSSEPNEESSEVITEENISEEPNEEKTEEPEPPVIPEVPDVPSDIQTSEPTPDNVPKVEQNNDSDTAEFLSDGYIIYRNAVYSIPYLVKSVAEKYGDTIDKYSELFPESRVSILVAPLSSGMIENKEIRKKITDQKKIIDSINSYCGDNINKINVYDALYEHRNKHIYFSSDHHWTALGAYYAYAEFARSVGLEPTPIEKMEKVLLNSSWKGTAYSMTGDERTKEFSDELYAYLPTKENTMTVYPKNGEVSKKNGCIRTSYKSYTAFIDGDNPYTIISVPENPSDMTVLVLKDSYGCAFVPYLCEHYGTIIVADPRHVYFDLYELLKDYPLKDIIFMTNIFNPNVSSWVKNVNRIIGN